MRKEYGPQHTSSLQNVQKDTNATRILQQEDGEGAFCVLIDNTGIPRNFVISTNQMLAASGAPPMPSRFSQTAYDRLLSTVYVFRILRVFSHFLREGFSVRFLKMC